MPRYLDVIGAPKTTNNNITHTHLINFSREEREARGSNTLHLFYPKKTIQKYTRGRKVNCDSLKDELRMASKFACFGVPDKAGFTVHLHISDAK